MISQFWTSEVQNGSNWAKNKMVSGTLLYNEVTLIIQTSGPVLPDNSSVF